MYRSRLRTRFFYKLYSFGLTLFSALLAISRFRPSVHYGSSNFNSLTSEVYHYTCMKLLCSQITRCMWVYSDCLIANLVEAYTM